MKRTESRVGSLSYFFNKYFIVCLFVSLFLFKSLFFWDQELPNVAPDEVSYLLQAKYFSGRIEYPDKEAFLLSDTIFPQTGIIPLSEGWPHYHFGYSLIVTPAYWISSNPYIAYKIVIVINCLLMSSLFLIIYSWLKILFDLSRNKAAIIAGITCLYPSFTMQAYIGWAENAIIPGYALAVLLLTKFLISRQTIWIIGFAIISGFIFTLHPRGLFVVATAFIFLPVLLMLKRANFSQVLIGLGIISTVVILTQYVNSTLIALMDSFEHSQGMISKLMGFFELDILPNVLGHFLYLVLASVGLVPLAIYVMVLRIYSGFLSEPVEWTRDVQNLTYLFILLSGGVLFVVGVFFHAPVIGHELESFNPSIDRYLYGRYNDAAISCFIAIGLYSLISKGELSKTKFPPTAFYIAFVIVFILSAGFWWYLDNILSYVRGMRSYHSPALFPWFLVTAGYTDWLKLGGLFVGPLFWIWIIFEQYFNKPSKAIRLVFIYFLLLSISVHVYMSPSLNVG